MVEASTTVAGAAVVVVTVVAVGGVGSPIGSPVTKRRIRFTIARANTA